MEKLMDAIVKPVAGPGLELRRVPVPVPGPGEVLIKVHKTAICGTDVHIYNWDPWAVEHIKPPMTIGHEYVGEIAELGEGVTGLHLGQRVSGEGHSKQDKDFCLSVTRLPTADADATPIPLRAKVSLNRSEPVTPTLYQDCSMRFIPIPSSVSPMWETPATTSVICATAGREMCSTSNRTGSRS